MNCWEAGKSEKVEMMLHLQGCPDVCRVSSTGSGTNHPRRWGRGSMWDGSPRVEQVSLMDLPSNTASKFGNTLSHALWASQVVLVVKKESACQSRRHKRHRFDPWVGKIPWRRAQWPTSVSLPGKSHGQSSLMSYSPWGRRVRHDWAI